MIFHHFAVLWDRAIWKMQNAKRTGEWYHDESVRSGFKDCGFAITDASIKAAFRLLSPDINQNLVGEYFTDCTTFLRGMIEHQLQDLTGSLAIQPTSGVEQEKILRMLVTESIANEADSTFLLQNIVVSVDELLEIFR